MGAAERGARRLTAGASGITRAWRRTAFLIGGWTIPAVAVTGQLYVQLAGAGRPANAAGLLAVQLARWWPWALATPAILRLARRSRPADVGWRGTGLRIAVAAVIGLPVYAAYTLIVELTIFQGIVMSPAVFAARVWTSTLLNLPLNLALLLGIVVGAHTLDVAADNRRRLLEEARLRSDLAEARLQALQFQLQPHFLFNTLHAIAALVDESPARAREMVGRLGELLRATLDLADEPEIPLAREVHLAEMYLEIERTRFEERLRYRVEVDPAVGGVLVPTLTLQPLVENAVRHGLGAGAGRGEIRVECRADHGELICRVLDDGAGLAATPARGIGTDNVSRRLEAIHGPRASLTLESGEGRGCVATVRIPLQP